MNKCCWKSWRGTTLDSFKNTAYPCRCPCVEGSMPPDFGKPRSHFLRPPSMPLHFLVTPEQAGQRLDKFLGTGCPDFSRARLQAFIRDGHALVNKIAAKPSYPLRDGDEVVFEIPQETVPSPLAAQDIPIDIIFEDETLIVLNKPAGLVVHPGAGKKSRFSKQRKWWSRTSLITQTSPCGRPRAPVRLRAPSPENPGREWR